MRTILNRLNYPQAHNIKVEGVNEALRERTIEYLHNKSKHDAKYRKSKQMKRMYEDKKAYEQKLKWK